jgi:hypothetical protein
MGSDKVPIAAGRSFMYVMKSKALELTLEKLHVLSFPSVSRNSEQLKKH